MDSPKTHAYLLFSDIKNFSKLDEDTLHIYASEFIPYLHQSLKKLFEKALAWNTWGDAIFIAFTDPNSIVDFAMMYKDTINNFDFRLEAQQKLVARIACHFGEVMLIQDPILEKKNLFGLNVNTAARLEPSTRPGEIFVTRAFKQNFENSPSAKKDIYAFDDVGEIQLAKAFGVLDVFRLRQANEEKQSIDWLTTLDLKKTLPEPPCATEGGIFNTQSLASLPKENIETILNMLLEKEVVNDDLLSAARLYNNIGLYEKSLECIHKLENFSMDVDGMSINPYKFKIDAQKIKANALTRLGRYNEAANIIYMLWASGHKDSDTLAMLAAQYKRRAIFGDSETFETITLEKINMDLLERSRDLYVEAFRINLDDYYPAINAAYLYKMFGAQNTGIGGTKFATYIKQAWKGKKGESWWLDVTLAEAELLMDDFKSAKEELEAAVSLHSPNIFELTSTHAQIKTYQKISAHEKNIQPIVDFLEEKLE